MIVLPSQSNETEHAQTNARLGPHAENSAATDPRSLIDEFILQQRDLTAAARFSRWHEQRVPAAHRVASYRSLIPLGKPKAGEQYAFAVDLDKCSGCKACVCACHSLNGLGEGEMWRSVGLLVGGNSAPHDNHPANTPSTDAVAFQQHVTAACHHCVEPGCADGCPVLAYEKDPLTGIVRHLDDQCIGCQYCSLKCPYDAPKYSAAKGIVRKCDMCHTRLAAGEAPACVQACPHEAIRIEIASQHETRHSCETPGAAMTPGAFPSNYTLPATRYRTSRKWPSQTLSADAAALRVEQPHWPLVWMLVLTQLAAGLHLLALFLSGAGAARLRTLNLLAFAALHTGLLASVAHLGRPLKAWRAFLGWRKSWMSREVAAFTLYAALASACAAVPASPALLAATTFAAAGAIVCSAMLYVDTRRPAWREPVVFTKFFGTAFLLGATGGAAWAGWCSPALAPGLAAVATLFRAALFAWESRLLFRARRDSADPAHVSARIAFAKLPRVLGVRTALFVLATIFSLLAVFNVENAAICGSIAFGATLTSQVLERYLFFATCNAPRMPGGAA